MQIFVKTLIGKTFTFEVKSSDTIGSLKAKIQDEADLRVKQQKLVFLSRLLEDAKTLADYGVQDRDTIQLQLCLCGC